VNNDLLDARIEVEARRDNPSEELMKEAAGITKKEESDKGSETKDKDIKKKASIIIAKLESKFASFVQWNKENWKKGSKWKVVTLWTFILLFVVGLFSDKELESTKEIENTGTNQITVESVNISEVNTIKEIDLKINELTLQLSKIDEQLSTINTNYPTFVVKGRIKERLDNAYYIWGRSIPKNIDTINHEAVSKIDGNIIVINPYIEEPRSSFYTAEHYFIRKSYEESNSGVAVPVLVFGEPDNVIYDNKVKLERDKEALTMIINKLKYKRTALK
jgi:hypothetical protein